ncbi:translation initiation factor eIF-2B [Acetobacter pasteurianus]|uniref:Translation initiation factor eIF2B subunit alpha n=1 Tax=Lodderomyces elongisporus (strain ATCC 11503 / CBS 2605 / JCM 1781 / NBRC 1676 / NRRL YB-4239) TaxID=379508 RepID=A5E767_LODEL|nr:translation initiation factor eIF-2B alpha subunit [Lodderomyces elongisporus NRRL YB-4239]MDC6271777.1 translation initiation factor eIF-2B [Acetobacter pasteurianus]
MATEHPNNIKLPSLGESFDITGTYLKFLEEDKDMTMPIAAIESLVTMLRFKLPSTSSELINLVSKNIEILKSSIPNNISLSAGCDLFMRFILRNTNIYSDWESFSKNLIENGELFVQRAKISRDKLAEFGVSFIKDDDIILVHSYSRVVFNLLLKAKQEQLTRFKVLVTELRPTENGFIMAQKLKEADIPCEVIVDNAVGYVLHKVDKIFVGAEGVAESGGIINHIGTYQIGCLAKVNNKPFYVITESHKFVRLFPLAPNDLPNMNYIATLGEQEHEFGEYFKKHSEQLTENKHFVDFTPHEYITALVTDLGVLTPSAVSEELIKIWYD